MTEQKLTRARSAIERIHSATAAAQPFSNRSRDESLESDTKIVSDYLDELWEASAPLREITKNTGSRPLSAEERAEEIHQANRVGEDQVKDGLSSIGARIVNHMIKPLEGLTRSCKESVAKYSKDDLPTLPTREAPDVPADSPEETPDAPDVFARLEELELTVVVLRRENKDLREQMSKQGTRIRRLEAGS